jgi:hypothetical protein
MRKRELDILLRRAGKIAREVEFYVIGSQAAHAFAVSPPAEVLLSQECDLYPKNRSEAANLLDQQLGSRSRFARKFGFFADVVTPELATLPAGWKTRVKPLRFGHITAFCLEIHDLAVSKLAAGRLKDLEFVGAILRTSLVKRQTLLRRIEMLELVNDRSRSSSVLNILIREIQAAAKTLKVKKRA